MKKQIRLPSGDLGYLGKINIDLEMTGAHFDALNLITNDHQEDTVLSILKDLMDEDPWLLTQIDLLYVFTLVKCSSLGDKLDITTGCTNTLFIQGGDGASIRRVCGSKQKFQIRITEADCVYFEGKVPTFTLKVGDKEETFNVRLPSMFTERDLLNYFEEKGHSRKEILTNKEVSLQYAKRRMAAALQTKDYSIDQLVDALSKASFRQNDELAEKVKELQKYGLRQKVYHLKCKECGGTFDYHLPLLAGISM